MSRRRHRELIERTLAGHQSISGCLAGFESALATPSSPAGATWRRVLQRRLAPLIDCLAQHSTSSEADGGLLSEIEVTLGRSHEISTARRLHRSATARAAGLFETLGHVGPDTNQDDLRTRGRRLASAIRRHHELEADLILMAFDQDIGTGD